MKKVVYFRKLDPEIFKVEFDRIIIYNSLHYTTRPE